MRVDPPGAGIEALGLIGKADVVEFEPDGTPYPVEYKHGSRHKAADIAACDDVQLAAQALCLEEIEHSVNSANHPDRTSSLSLNAVRFARIAGKTLAAFQLGNAASRALHSARVG